MDEHVVEWDKQLSADGVHTNRWMHELCRKVLDQHRLRTSGMSLGTPAPAHIKEDERIPIPPPEPDRAAIQSQQVIDEHNARVAASAPFERLILYAVVLGVLALGAWGAAQKKEERSSATPQPKSQLMQCASLANYKDQAECLERSGIALDERDDAKADVRRR